MVNLDTEPKTNDLRFNENEEMVNRLDVEGEEYEEGEESEEGSEEDEEGIEENEEGIEENEESSEEGEKDEGSEDERCEASRRFKWRKRFVARLASRTREVLHGEDERGEEDEVEGNKQGSEDGKEDEDSEGGMFILDIEPNTNDFRFNEDLRFNEREEMGNRLDVEGEEYEEEEVSEKDGSEGGEGSEENEESSEEGEKDEGSEDERCKASRRSWKRFAAARLTDRAREVHDEDECGEENEVEGNEQGSEDGTEDEDSEGDGEDERCEAASPCFEWWKTYVAHEEDEGGEEDEVNGNEQDSEDEKEDEDGEEDSEDERYEASPCLKWGKMFVEHEEDGVEGNEQGSEDGKKDEDDGKYETREASPCFDFGKASVVRPTSEKHEEDEDGEEDEIVEGPEKKESEGDEESDISDSEINEYKEAVHKLLKFRTYKIKGPNGQLRCPFCVHHEKQDYNRLLEHAVQVAEGPTKSAKQRANHFAMAKYLVIDFANDVEQLPLSANKFLHNLTLELDLRKENMDQLQSKYEEKTMAIRRILEETDETQHTFFEEARNMLCIARDQSKRVLEQEEMLSFDFENKRRRLNSWSQELNKREAALTEEKRKMDDLMREKNDLDRRPNDELLEAGKELMKGLEDMPSHCRVKIGVKRGRDEIDEKAFMDECNKRYILNEAETEAFEQCCFWVKKLRDDKGLLNENDELLRALKDKWDSKIYNAVIEFNTNNGNSMELWNFEEDRKASHCEVIRHVFSRWKTLQCKRDEIDEIINTLF